MRIKIFKKIIVFFLLSFSFQTILNAEEINEIEIEGLSVGSSLLDNFSKSEIEVFKQNSTAYTPHKFEVIFINKKLENYDRLQVTIKPNDQKYMIYSIGGILDFDNKIKECRKKSAEILKDIKSVIKNYEEVNDQGTHSGDPSGESVMSGTWLFLDSGGYISVNCADYGQTVLEKNGWTDELSIDLASKEFKKFMQYEAYK